MDCRCAAGWVCEEAAAHDTSDCIDIVSVNGDRMRTTVFGAVPVEDYMLVMELHTRHHGKQMADA